MTTTEIRKYEIKRIITERLSRKREGHRDRR